MSKKLSVNDAAELLGVSKEAIHNRIRRGSLKSEFQNGVKMVFLDDEPVMDRGNKSPLHQKNSKNQDNYYRFLEDQNEKLQLKVEKLELETRSLRDQKEQMLIDERKKIEQIYREKDEQLKNILEALSNKFMLNAPSNEIEAEIVESVKGKKLISLSKYLKNQGVSKKRRSKIKKYWENSYMNDERMIKKGEKYYIDFDSFDYSGLL